MDSKSSHQIIYPLLEVSEVLQLAEGECKQSILIVYKKDDQKEENLRLLSNILKAIQFDLQEDVLLIGITNNQSFKLIDLRKQKDINTVLLFGVSATQLGLNWQLAYYTFIEQMDCQFLISHSLNDIASQKTYKMLLWQSLKAHFLGDSKNQ